MSTPTSMDMALLSFMGYPFIPSPNDTRETLDLLTAEAIKQIQNRHTDRDGRPLQVTGIVDEETRAAMIREVFRRVRSTKFGTRVVQIALREAAKIVREDVKGKRLNTDRGAEVEKYQRVTDYWLDDKERGGWPWCAAFVSWVYEEAGFPLRESYVPDLVAFGKRKGYWFPSTAKVPLIPPRGAIFIAKKRNHTGIVVGVDGADIFTVEGNTWSGMQGDQRSGIGLFQRVRAQDYIEGYLIVQPLLEDWWRP